MLNNQPLNNEQAAIQLQEIFSKKDSSLRERFTFLNEEIYTRIVSSYFNSLRSLQLNFAKSKREWLYIITEHLVFALQKQLYTGINADLILRYQKINQVAAAKLNLETNVQYAYDVLARTGIKFSVKLILKENYVQKFESLQQYLKNILAVSIVFQLDTNFKDQKDYSLGQLIEQQNDSKLTLKFRELLGEKKITDLTIKKHGYAWLDTSNYANTGEMLIKTAIKNFAKVYDISERR